MEVALNESYKTHIEKDERPYYQLVHEYSLGGKPPMMTHFFENEQQRIIAAKGAVEASMAVSQFCKAAKLLFWV